MGLVMNQNLKYFKAVEDKDYLLAEKLLKNGANPYSYNNVIIKILIKNICQNTNEKKYLLIEYIFNNFELQNFDFFTVVCEEIHNVEIYRSPYIFQVLNCLILKLDKFSREKNILVQQIINLIKDDIEEPNLKDLSCSELILQEKNLFLLLKESKEVKNKIKSLVKVSLCLKKLSTYYTLENF